MSSDLLQKSRKKQNPKSADPAGSVRSYAQWSGLAFQMVAVVCAGYFLGMKGDQWAGNPDALFTLSGVVAGVIAAMALAIRTVLTKNKKS